MKTLIKNYSQMSTAGGRCTVIAGVNAVVVLSFSACNEPRFTVHWEAIML